MRKCLTVTFLWLWSIMTFAGCAGAGAAFATPPVTPANTATWKPSPAHTPNVLSPVERSSELTTYLINGDEHTNVAQAQAQLFQEGLRFYLIVVSPQSTGLEADIYQDLVKRNIRATTGPDEGFDTQSLECHPNCVFIYGEAVNALSVASWKNVLRHEQRHMVQAANNPDLAREFRQGTEGLFTTYAAFLEACADDGILVAEEIYHASERMPVLKDALGAENYTTLERACQGIPEAYDRVVKIYEAKKGTGAFARLFPPYQ